MYLHVYIYTYIVDFVTNPIFACPTPTTKVTQKEQGVGPVKYNQNVRVFNHKFC